MSHSFSLISTLAIGFAIAWALGFVMERIKVPALVGYLLAGIIISPATPGLWATSVSRASSQKSVSCS